MVNNDQIILNPLLSDVSNIRKESRKRAKPFDFISIKAELLDDYVKDGWEIDRVLKTKTRVKRLKKIDELYWFSVNRTNPLYG